MVDITRAVFQKELDYSLDEDKGVFNDEDYENDSLSAPDENEEDAFRRLTLEAASLVEMLIEDDDARIMYADEIEQISETIEETKEILGIKY